VIFGWWGQLFRSKCERDRRGELLAGNKDGFCAEWLHSRLISSGKPDALGECFIPLLTQWKLGWGPGKG
jgi:hypothetical protein